MFVVFRSRGETISFASLLSSYSVAYQIVSTPRKVNVACGICIKISPNSVQMVRNILSRRKYPTFAGIYQ